MVNEELIKESYEILRVSADISKTYYQQKLVVLYSGGKDSDVLLQLARECLSPDDFRVVNSHVTVDAPQTVYYIRDKFKELASEGIETETIFHRDKDGKPITMWSLILDKKTPPTRFKRYCCKELKEVSAPNSFSCTGVRGDESSKRRGRDSFTVWNSKSSKAPYFSLEHTKEVFENAKMERERERLGINDKSVWDCTLVANAKDKKHLISQPIYKWERSDVWNFIHDRNMKINPLYDMGFERVGCVGCPLGGRKSMLKEFEMFPKYKECYIRAFDKMLEERRKAGKDDVTNNEGWHRWETGKDVFDWWICEGSVNVKGQLSLFDNESEV